MDVTITMPKKLLEQLYIAACNTEDEVRGKAAMTARWEADPVVGRRHDLDRDAATRAACRLEKAEYRSQVLRDAVIDAGGVSA